MIPMKRLSRICDGSREIRKSVALELEASYPFPIRAGGGLLFAAFYYARFRPPAAEVDDLYPPRWLVTLSAEGGVISIEDKPPTFFGIEGSPDAPFARHAFTYDWSREEVEANLDVFFENYDVLVGRWVDDGFGGTWPGDSKEKVLFRELFDQISAPPLISCYLAVDGDFFRWVGYGGSHE